MFVNLQDYCEAHGLNSVLSCLDWNFMLELWKAKLRKWLFSPEGTRLDQEVNV